MRYALIAVMLIAAAMPMCAHAQALVAPLAYINSSAPAAVGIASYGLYNISNDSGPYRVETNEVVGYALVNSMYAYNATPPQNTSAEGATVQLNAVINITSGSGKAYSYWLQDVLDMNTSNHTYSIGDNLWNMSDIVANVSNGTISGYGGIFNSTASASANDTFYSYFPNYTVPYGYPVRFIPVMRVYIANGLPVAQFGYYQNGTTFYYDNVTFNIHSTSVHFLVTPYYYTPSSTGPNSTNFYDDELVIGGEGSGEISAFTKTNAELWIGYQNGSALQPFPTAATFGLNTQEAAQGLAVSQAGGDASVTEGNLPDNETIRLSGVPRALLGFESQPSTSVTTAPQTSSAPSTMPTTAKQNISRNYTSSAQGQGSGIPSDLYLYIIAIIVLILFAFLLLRFLSSRQG
ncbi:MAG: thermopsin family protease [Candidatus Micrarchaeota archaeon]|nr:thermopsin family protease [Candidatus Micrarchaeota archaeon]